MIIMEHSKFFNTFLKGLPEDLKRNEKFMKYVTGVKLEYYADYIAMTLPSPRFKWYA